MRLRRRAAFPTLPRLRPRRNAGSCGKDLARAAMPVQRMAVQVRTVQLLLGLFAVICLGLRRLGLLLLSLFQRLAFGLCLEAEFFGPRLGALFLALLFASRAFAADRLQIGFEVIGAVIVIDLLARLDLLDGADEDLALARLDVGFGVRLAGVVDVAGDVLAHRTVDGPAAAELEQIFVLDRVVFFLLRIQERPKITDNFGALLDRFGGEEAKSGAGAADAVGFVRWDSRHDD